MMVSVARGIGTIDKFGEHNHLAQYVASADPNLKIPHIQEGMQIQALDYNMWASFPQNKEYFTRQVFAYVNQAQRANYTMNKLCRFELTDKEIHLLFKTMFSNTPAVLNAPGTLIPYITSTQESSVTVHTYHSQSFDVDFYTMDTPEGREDVSLKVTRMALDVIRTNLNSLIMTLFTMRPGTRFPKQRNGGYALARTPFEYAIQKQRDYAIMNKKRNASNIIVQGGNEVFSQYGEGMETRFVLCSIQDSMYLNDYVYMNRGQLRMGIGAGSVATIDLPLNYGPYEVLPLPMIQKNLHDPLNNTFERLSATGSAVNFSTMCNEEHPADYRSWHRDVHYAGKEGMNRYTLLDNIMHQVEYVPLDSGEADAGHLDYAFLNRFVVKELNEAKRNVFTKMKFKKEMNRDQVSEYLVYDHSSGKYYPTVLMGQIPQVRCRDEYMEAAGNSFYHALFSVFTDEEKNIIAKELDKLFKSKLKKKEENEENEENEEDDESTESSEDQGGMMEKLKQRLEEISPGNAFFNMNHKESTDEFGETILGLKLFGESFNDMLDAKETYGAKESPIKRRQTRITNEYANDPLMRFAQLANLSSLRTLQTAIARDMYDIQHPTGAMNLRHEWQMMSNMLLVAANEGEACVFYTGTPDEVRSTDPISKKENFQMGFSHGVQIEDERKFHWARNVRGGRIYGGFNRKYADPSDIKDARGRMEIIDHLMTKGSNVAVAASYNQAVEGLTDNPHLRVFDDRGYFHKELRRHVDGTEWLLGDYDSADDVICAGLPMYNYVMKADQEEDLDDRDLTRLNFNEDVALEFNNHFFTRLNSWTYDPKFETNVMCESYHPLGNLDDNTVKYLTSHSNMVQDDFTPEKIRAIKKQRFDAVNC